MTAFMLGELCQEIGFPKGVLNIVQGTGSRVGSALTQHRDIKAVTFTGSTRTGGEIARATAPGFKKLALEMGGKNPTIVFADCDFDETVKQTLRAAFSNQGQICLCGSRILVDRSIYPKFRDALVARTKELVVGDPLEEKTDQGALVSKNHFDKVATCVSVAKEEGGRILTGGKPLEIKGRCQGGWFFEPTLVENLASGCRTNQEEIFGPVATLLPFLSEVEAVAVANDTAYGLSASVFTGDLKRAHRVAAQIESGIVWINTWMNRDLRTPFGGVKNSGLGREGGLEALRFFTEIKNICLDI
jgi:aminomuconate-semialdehyde/2-hydroxymuconate-6-semialdehyde dehydrogenase